MSNGAPFEYFGNPDLAQLGILPQVEELVAILFSEIAPPVRPILLVECDWIPNLKDRLHAAMSRRMRLAAQADEGRSRDSFRSFGRAGETLRRVEDQFLNGSQGEAFRACYV
jgi:hypothetical protein